MGPKAKALDEPACLPGQAINAQAQARCLLEDGLAPRAGLKEGEPLRRVSENSHQPVTGH